MSAVRYVCVYMDYFRETWLVCVFNSAGLDWNEEAETYESSFYKRSLDNNLYIFTPTRCSGKENKGNFYKFINAFIFIFFISPIQKKKKTRLHSVFIYISNVLTFVLICFILFYRK